MRPDIGMVSFMHLAQKHATGKCPPGCGDENAMALLLKVPRCGPEARQALTGIRGEGTLHRAEDKARQRVSDGRDARVIAGGAGADPSGPFLGFSIFYKKYHMSPLPPSAQTHPLLR